MESFTEVVNLVKAIIKDQISDTAYNVWISVIEPVKFENNQAVIQIKTPFQRDVLIKHYLEKFENAFESVLGFPVEVVIVTENDLKNLVNEKDIPQPVEEQPPVLQPDYENTFGEPSGNYEFTFDTFIVGPSNNFAYAACKAITTDNQIRSYNPLFIYGPSGLGKTHLLTAISNEIKKNHPERTIISVSSETFTNELIAAISSRTIDAFHNKYRKADILLVDDIQFISGKESTQEEFFHTFNHLHTSGKQIIISSDKPPKDIETLEARLRTRFEWGLIADISSPNYETRMAILQKKIELDHLEKYNIPNDVLEYIATNVKTNIRELEGSLNKLIALYKLNNNESIDIALAAEALKDIISSDNKREVTPELILDIVSDHFGVSIADLKGGKRNAEIVFPRQIAMYLIRNMTEASLKAVGVILGGKDHSTIKHGIEKIENELQADETLSNTINIIKKKINPA